MHFRRNFTILRAINLSITLRIPKKILRGTLWLNPLCSFSMSPRASPANQFSPQAAQRTPCKIKGNVLFYYYSIQV